MKTTRQYLLNLTDEQKRALSLEERVAYRRQFPDLPPLCFTPGYDRADCFGEGKPATSPDWKETTLAGASCNIDARRRAEASGHIV